jgi:hypothetical protein
MYLSVSHVQGNGHDNMCIGIERLFDNELIEIILSGFIIFVGISYCFEIILPSMGNFLNVLYIVFEV